MSEVEINSGDYKARIRMTGAGLSTLSYKGRDLVDPFQPSDTRFFRGDVLAPWPNRIGDGIYEVAGKTFTAPINEGNRKTALHGLIFGLNWEVTEQSDSTVTLEVDLPASDSYPTSLHFAATYQLTSEGLEITITAQNQGDVTAPYGVSIHPYLIASTDSSVNEWSLKLPSNKVLEVDEVRLLPIALRDCSDLNFEFQRSSVIGTRFIDHAFKVDEGKPRAITVKAPSGAGVSMTFDETSKWIQIHTADRDGGENSRICLAVEPMTCPPDAFRSGEDLIWLNAGDRTASSWRIQNLQGDNDEE
jgi:aldose 1-epimerase